MGNAHTLMAVWLFTLKEHYMNQIEQIKIRDLMPNPFRRIEEYRIPEEKIEALIRSFKTSGFWPTVIARRFGTGWQQAFGHARVAAGKKLFGPDHEIDVVVMKLTDEEMLRMMADENGELWGTDFLVDMETVQAVIDAHQTGKIRLESPNAGKRRVIVRANGNNTPPYTALGIGNFLGWVLSNGVVQAKVETALHALDYIKEGALDVSDFAGLGNKQAQALIQQTSRIKRITRHTTPEQAEQRKNLRVKVAKAVSTAMKAGTGYRDARKVAEKVIFTGGIKVLPEAEKAIPLLCRSINSFLSEHNDTERRQKVQDVIDAKSILTPDLVHQVWAALSVVIDTCENLRKELKPSRRAKKATSGAALALPAK